MYKPPIEIDAQVFTTIPPSLRHPVGESPWTRLARPGLKLHSFLEGPAFDREGNLYCVDVAYGRIFRVDPAGNWSLAAQYDGNPNGLKIHKDGRIFIADAARGIVVLDPATGTLSSHLEGYQGLPFQACNDLFFSSAGDLYFTDPGLSSLSNPVGRLFCARVNGQLELLLDRIPYPNGLVLDETESYVHLAITHGNCIWRVSAARGPEPRPAGLFIQLSGGLSGPDGLALDAQGNLAIAHARHGTVWLFSKTGEPLVRIRSTAGRWTTNVAYAPDTATLFITEAESGSILKAELEVPGSVMFAHAW